MLVTFRCSAVSEVVMAREHAQHILDVLDKDAAQGVILAAEIVEALLLLEQIVEESRAHPASDYVQRDLHAHRGYVPDEHHKGVDSVSFAARAYPLLEMLRSARHGGSDVLWGV
jgi:hypothetical protein